jgi:hypothetical protein
MTYRVLTIFFIPELIAIIMCYGGKTKEQILKERLHIEMRHKSIMQDIKSSRFLYELYSKNRIKKYVSNLNADIQKIKNLMV